MEIREELNQLPGFEVIAKKYVGADKYPKPCTSWRETCRRAVGEERTGYRNLHGLPLDAEWPAVWVGVVGISDADVIGKLDWM